MNVFATRGSRNRMSYANPWTVKSPTTGISDYFQKSFPESRGQVYPKWAIQVPSVLSYMFYTSLLVFVIFLILVFIHFIVYPVFSFSPNDNGFIPIPTASDRQIDFVKAPAPSNVAASFKNLPACSYTIGMDVYLSGTFQASQIPRVLLYRAKSDVKYTGTVSDMLSRFPDTNLIVWIDPMKNDLYASAVTVNAQAQRLIDPTPHIAVENIPVKKVFRLTVVFTPKFLEVYINGKLEVSHPFKNSLSSIADTSVFYGPLSAVNNNVMISNLALWPRILTAREVRSYGSPITNEAFYSPK